MDQNCPSEISRLVLKADRTTPAVGARKSAARTIRQAKRTAPPRRNLARSPLRTASVIDVISLLELAEVDENDGKSDQEQDD